MIGHGGTAQNPMIHRMGAKLLVAAALLGLGSPAWAARVSRYLVDGRIHLTVVYRADGTGGQIAWFDTVTGREGGAPFRVQRDGHLELHLPSGRVARARLLPDVAVVMESPPWGGRGETALGVNLD